MAEEVIMDEELISVVGFLAHQFRSANEADSNGEVANVVDGLYMISRSIRSLARAIADPEEWRQMNPSDRQRMMQ